MKTTFLAAAATALLLLLLPMTGLLPPLSGMQAGYLALGAYLLIFAFGRLLATRRAARTQLPPALEEAPVPAPVQESTTAQPQGGTEPVSTEAKAPAKEEPRNEGLVSIGGRQYSIKADSGYLAHIGSDFDPHMTRLCQLLASDSATILDVGANVGCTTILFSNLAKHVHAFEPSKDTVALLEDNLQAARAPNVRIHQVALGRERGTVEFVSSPHFRAGAFVGLLSEVTVGHVAEQVPVRTLDEVVAESGIRNIDFIKIDTEGYDGEVVAGATEVLRSNKPVVLLELNHWCLNVYRRQSVPDYLDHLRSVFPLLYALGNDGQTYLDLQDKDHRYHAMYRHILHGDYSNLLGGFDKARLQPFYSSYESRILG